MITDYDDLVTHINNGNRPRRIQIMKERMAEFVEPLDRANTRFADLMKYITELIRDAIVQKQIHNGTWTNFTRAVRGVREAIRTCTLNARQAGAPPAINIQNWPFERGGAVFPIIPNQPTNLDMFTIRPNGIPNVPGRGLSTSPASP